MILEKNSWNMVFYINVSEFMKTCVSFKRNYSLFKTVTYIERNKLCIYDLNTVYFSVSDRGFSLPTLKCT